MFFTIRNFGIPLGFITMNFTHPFASRLFQAPKKNTNPTRKRVTTEPKRRPRFAFAMAKMIKPKRPDGFLKSFFFSKTFFASSTLLLGLFFNGLAQFSMIFCQKLPYLGDFVASFCLTKGGNGSRGEHVLAPRRLALWCFCKAFFSGCTVMVSGFFVFPNLAAGFAIDVESIPNLSSSQERWPFCPVHDL